MSPPMRQSVARISEELGIHVMTLYKWRKTWRLQGEVVPASEKEPEGWSAADKFTVSSTNELGSSIQGDGPDQQGVGVNQPPDDHDHEQKLTFKQAA